MDLAQIDRTSDFLQGMSERSADAIISLAWPRKFAPGTVLFREGGANQDLYLLIDGHVRLEMTIPNRGRVPILTVGPGEVLAWSALLSDGVMTTSAIALDTVQAAAIGGAALRNLCEQQPETGYHVMKQLAAALSRRLVATRLQLLDLFAGHESILDPLPLAQSTVDPQC